MSAQSDQIEAAVSVAQQALIDAANDGPYTDALQALLDQTTLALQTVENNLVLDTQDAILTALANTNDQLKSLNAQIDAYTASIDQVAASVKKISNVVGVAVTVIGGVVSAGVI